MSAEALFDQGKDLMRAGRFEEACRAFEASQAADPGIGTQFHLADCWQHVGREASAWALFREVESEARAVGQFAREHVAHDRAGAIEPRLPKLIVAPHALGGVPGVEIRRDGQAIVREQWDVPVPIDPGQHVVTMLVPGKRPWEKQVLVPPGAMGMYGIDLTVVRVDLPPLADIADVPTVAGPGGQGAAQASAQAGPARVAQGSAQRPPGVASTMPDASSVFVTRGGAQRAIGWFVVGAGLAGLGTSAYFIVSLSSDLAEAAGHCSGGVCDDFGARLRHDANVHEITAIATGTACTAGVLLGALLVATAPGPKVIVSGGLKIMPMVGRGTSGIVVHGAW